MSSRADQKRALREEREQREQADAERAATRKRLGLLGGLIALALVVVVALVLLSGGDDKSKSAGSGGDVAGAAETTRTLRGIPQRGDALGRRDAPVTLVQFVDLQCPFCGQWDTKALPEVVRRYVRPGRLRIEQRTLRFLGPDSRRAASHAAAAAQRNRLFEFSGVFYRNQGQENSGYVTPSFLAKIARGAGLDPAVMKRRSQLTAAEDLLVKAERQASTLGINSTPSFAIGRTGKTLERVELPSLTAEAMSKQIDRVLKSTQ